MDYIAWAMGLNPYNYLQECFGGAISQNGIISEDEQSARMIVPGSVPMPRSRREEYLQVSKIFCLRFLQ